MEKISDSHLNMQRTTAQFYKENKPKLDTVAAITENFVSFDANMVIIEAALTDALNDPTVAAGIAEKLKIELAKATEKVALGAAAYAEVVKNATLLQIMKVRASALIGEKKDRLPTLCQQVHDEANKVIDQLAPYNVTKADLDTLNAAIPPYSAAANSPRLSHGNVKSATDTVVETLRLNNELLKTRLDRLVLTLSTTEPALVVGWKNARKLVNQPSKHTSLLVTVLDDEGKPVTEATVKVSKGTVVRTGQTGENGQCEFKPVSIGEVSLSVEAPGYQPSLLNKLKMVKSEENIYEVRLQPLA
ncbi:MAG: carboxypeptidase regulatory-like domain-containing protein [Saprospiraceae bacterium]|nr:carboxypeptidase regulatory-like domain-containing protein [Saprospiraceae bacterium]